MAVLVAFVGYEEELTAFFVEVCVCQLEAIVVEGLDGGVGQKKLVIRVRLILY